MKKLITICIFLVTAFSVTAQSHISKGDYRCLLVPNSGNGLGGVSCPACQVKIKRDQEAKTAEDKRRADAVYAKSKADDKAREIARKKELAELAEKNKMTEVFVTMPKSNVAKSNKSNQSETKTNTITNDESTETETPVKTSEKSSSSSSTQSSTSEATIYNNIFMAEAAKKQQEEKAYQDLAKGVVDLFTTSAEESERKSQEYLRKIEYKRSLDKSLEEKKELAKNGDDQSYYDIYLAYQYSYPKDARHYRRLAYSTDNASLFKKEKSIENKSPKGIYIGIQSGEISRAGINYLETTKNFGFFMSFRASINKVDVKALDDDQKPKTRDVYSDSQGNVYTFISEASKSEQGRYGLSLGSSFHIYKPLFIYAGVGFGYVNTFSYRKKEDINNKIEIVKLDESFLGGTTDAGIILKLGRRIALNGGLSFMNLKYPEYVAGLSFNFWPEK